MSYTLEQTLQANLFAYALLMPEREYRKQIAIHTHGNTVDTKAIACYFGVEVKAAAERGYQLGLLKQPLE